MSEDQKDDTLAGLEHAKSEDGLLIGNIKNYYGGLSVRAWQGKYEWSIEDCSGHNWHEIERPLFEMLLQHQITL